MEEKNLLGNIIGIYLAGSYARGEETEESDIDILIITDNYSKQEKIGKFEIFFIPRERFVKSLKKSLYLASMISESKAIINNEFLQSYKEKAREVAVGEHLREIKSIARINKGMVEIDREFGKKVMDETMYSIILRLRETYLIECLKNNKIPSRKEFLDIVSGIATQESYNAYLRIKNKMRSKAVIPVEEAKSLIVEILKRVKRLKNGKKK